MENNDSSTEFRFADFLNYIRERALKFTLITVIVAGIAVILTHLVTMFVIPAEYKSESKVLIEGKSSDVIIGNYREIVGSRTVLTKAIEETGVETTVEKLMKKVDVAAEKDANFLTISVLSDSSNNAMKLNKAITAEFVKAAQPLSMGSEKLKLQVFDTASTPNEPTNKNYLKNDGIAAAVTLMISLFVMYNAFLSAQTKKEVSTSTKVVVKNEAKVEEIAVKRKELEGRNETPQAPGTRVQNAAEQIKAVGASRRLGKVANAANMPVVYR